MEERPSAPSSPPVIDLRQMPLGVLPRHLQHWALLGIAVVMIGILAMTGSPATPHQTTTPSPAAAALDPNQQRIEAYQRRIQEQAERLAREQTALARAKSAAADASERPGGSPLGVGERPATIPASSTAVAGSSSATTGSVQQERAQRDYRSLFADNVAFDKVGAHEEPRIVTPSAGAQTPRGRPAAAGHPPSVPSPLETAAAPSSGASGSVRPNLASTAVAAGVSAAVTSHEMTYRLPEGTIIETVLTNRLDGTFAGPVNCLVTTPAYAADAQHLLIPAGSRVLGEAKPVNTFGQSRLAVVFHRLLLPSGSNIDLHDFHGLDQVGEVGLRDQVDRHYAQIFGASLAVGAIAGLAQAQTTVGLDATALDVYRQGAAANLAQSSARILDRFLNLLPTVTIREGHRIKVYLSNDLELPVYRDTLSTPGGRP